MGLIRMLLLADTHLGFDLPQRPRIQRRRRGPEFFDNFKRALSPALGKTVDCVVHGGDLLFRSKVPAGLVRMAAEPLKHVAQLGIPIYIVPGNHERSHIPHEHLLAHPNIHIFRRPATYLHRKNGLSVALAGFPCVRHNIRGTFSSLIEKTGWHRSAADISVLCMHQAIDGATVGPSGYTFRNTQDVIRASDLPQGFSAVLAGHIHRFQVLAYDHRAAPMAAPVFYPGAVDRTSFAERKEEKGYVRLDFAAHPSPEKRLQGWKFHTLPTRPMIRLELNSNGMTAAQTAGWLESRLRAIPHDAIVQLIIHGRVDPETSKVFRARVLRSLAPATMNIEARMMDCSNW